MMYANIVLLITVNFTYMLILWLVSSGIIEANKVAVTVTMNRLILSFFFLGFTSIHWKHFLYLIKLRCTKGTSLDINSLVLKTASCRWTENRALVMQIINHPSTIRKLLLCLVKLAIKRLGAASSTLWGSVLHYCQPTAESKLDISTSCRFL